MYSNCNLVLDCIQLKGFRRAMNFPAGPHSYPAPSAAPSALGFPGAACSRAAQLVASLAVQSALGLWFVFLSWNRGVSFDCMGFYSAW